MSNQSPREKLRRISSYRSLVNMTKNLNRSPFPQVGRILSFALDCFGITRAEAGLSSKQGQRLATGKEMKPETFEKISRKVLYAIYKHLSGLDNSSIQQVFDEWKAKGGIDQYLPASANGVVLLNRDQFLRDSLELCIRVNHLNQLCPTIKPSKASLGVWIEHVLWPYITSTYVDYVLADNNPDEGMPGGDIWILPSEDYNESDPHKPVWTWPTQKVLTWWEDLLGEELRDLRHQLGGAARGDSPRRCIDRWMSGGNIDSQTIERWTNQEWKYKGAFIDNPNLPLATRWNECKEFLILKGYCSHPEELGEQIPGIRGITFETILGWERPISEGKPVEQIINQVSRRWQPPTNKTLRARLLIARAANRAWEESLRYLGPVKTRMMKASFAMLYNRYMDISLSTERGDMNGKFERYQEIEDANPTPFMITAGAMLCRECESMLPLAVMKLAEEAESIDDESMTRAFRNNFPGKS